MLTYTVFDILYKQRQAIKPKTRRFQMFELILKSGVTVEQFISRHGMANDEILDI